MKIKIKMPRLIVENKTRVNAEFQNFRKVTGHDLFSRIVVFTFFAGHRVGSLHPSLCGVVPPGLRGVRG